MTRASHLYDVHCHLHDAQFDADRNEVIERARVSGVRRALTVAEDLRDAYRVLEVAARHADFLVPALGIHPDRAALVSDAEVAQVVGLVRANKGILGAVGEIGLDFRPCWDQRAKDRQIEVFRAMIALGRELDLPLSVHSRSAGHHAVRVLEEEGAGKTDLHAFDGKAVHGERGAALGYFFSIPPSVVRSTVKQKLVPRLPSESLLLESDSPVLGPDQGARNEPGNLLVALEAIAGLRGVAISELSATLEVNTGRIFPKLVS